MRRTRDKKDFESAEPPIDGRGHGRAGTRRKTLLRAIHIDTQSFGPIQIEESVISWQNTPLKRHRDHRQMARIQGRRGTPESRQDAV